MIWFLGKTVLKPNYSQIWNSYNWFPVGEALSVIRLSYHRTEARSKISYLSKTVSPMSPTRAPPSVCLFNYILTSFLRLRQARNRFKRLSSVAGDGIKKVSSRVSNFDCASVDHPITVIIGYCDQIA